LYSIFFRQRLDFGVAFGYNIIEEILSMMYSFLRDEEQQKFIIWDQESDYYVCEYLNDSGNIKMKLYYCSEVCDESVISQEKFKLEQMDVIFTEIRDLWSWSKEMYGDIRKLYSENKNDKMNSDCIKELIDKLGYFYKI
jgi:hypothetical protein